MTLTAPPLFWWWQPFSAATWGSHHALQNSEALGPAANSNTTVRMVARNTTSSHGLCSKNGAGLASPGSAPRIAGWRLPQHRLPGGRRLFTHGRRKSRTVKRAITDDGSHLCHPEQFAEPSPSRLWTELRPDRAVTSAMESVASARACRTGRGCRRALWACHNPVGRRCLREYRRR